MVLESKRHLGKSPGPKTAWEMLEVPAWDGPQSSWFCQQLRQERGTPRGLGSGPSWSTLGSKACRAGGKTSDSVTVNVWHFLLTPQTAVFGSPGTQSKVSLACLALYPHQQPSPPPIPLPSPPATDLKATYSPRWPLALGFSPAPLHPPTNPPSAAGGKRTVKVYCGNKRH